MKEDQIIKTMILWFICFEVNCVKRSAAFIIVQRAFDRLHSKACKFYQDFYSILSIVKHKIIDEYLVKSLDKDLFFQI